MIFNTCKNSIGQENLCIFAFLPPKNRHFGHFWLLFSRFWCTKKRLWCAKSRPWWMETPALYTHPFLWGAKQSIKQMAFRTKNGTKRHFQCAFRPYLCIWNKQTALLRCHETPLLAIETRIFLTSPIFPLSSQPRKNFRRGKEKKFSLRSRIFGQIWHYVMDHDNCLQRVVSN